MAWFFGKKKKKAKEAEKKVEPSTPVSQPEVEASPERSTNEHYTGKGTGK